MDIYYKMCFENFILAADVATRPDFIQDKAELISACAKSLFKQISEEDSVFFLLDGRYDESFNDILFYCLKRCKQVSLIRVDNYYNSFEQCFNIAKTRDPRNITYICEDDYLHIDDSLQEIKNFCENNIKSILHPTKYPGEWWDTDEKYRPIKTTTYTFACYNGLIHKYYNSMIAATDNPYDFGQHTFNDVCKNNNITIYNPKNTLAGHITDGTIPCSMLENIEYIYYDNLNEILI